MTFEGWLLTAGTLVFALGLLFELIFDFDYGLSQAWWLNWVGWMFMLNSLAIVCAGLTILLGRILGPAYTGRPLLTLLTFTVFAASCGMRYYVYLRERGRPIDELPITNRGSIDLRGTVVRARKTRREQRAARSAFLAEIKEQRRRERR